MILSFEAGEFVLTNCYPRTGHGLAGEGWAYRGDGRYVTGDFKVAAGFRRWANEKAERIFNRAFVKTYPAPTLPLPLFLDAHQRKGVEWILTRSRSYLAHAPGAGKTCEAIVAACLTPGGGQVLFIVPPSLTINWARETLHWAGEAGHPWPSVMVVPLTENRADVGWRADFVICPDSMLTKDWVLMQLATRNWKFVAVDEASRFKEPTAQRTIALFGGKLTGGAISPGLVQEARHAVLLDGSPMLNRAMDLWAPTYAMAPETIDFKSQQDFGFRYCGAKMNSFGRWEFKYSSNEAELKAKLQDSFMHVVTEEELEHPERKRSILYMTDDPSPATDDWESRVPQVLKLVDAKGEEASQGELARFRRELGIAKVDWIADYVRSRLADKGESILLFVWHREVVEALAEELHKFSPGVVMGGTKANVREEYFKHFQAGKLPLIIGNIAAMGRGHNLQRADRVIFGEYSWTDETNKQAEKRAARKGRAKELSVRCEYIVAPNTLDEMILNSVFRKAKAVRKVIG